MAVMPKPQIPSNHAQSSSSGSVWETPRVEVISLSCEITAYAPDGEPLF
jgi:coenzyme PQQ precursor peptide PqqA